MIAKLVTKLRQTPRIQIRFLSKNNSSLAGVNDRISMLLCRPRLHKTALTPYKKAQNNTTRL